MHFQVRRGGVRAGEVVAGLRLGIFGGAFNPPHIGHLVLAQEALIELELDSVLFVPTARPPHREIDQDPGPALRAEMCDQAVAGDERIEVSRLELERSGPSYTSETLRSLRADRPGDELFLLLGGDQAAALGSWHEPHEVLALATVAVAERDEWRREEICDRLSSLGGGDAVTFFDMPRLEISSTAVRRRARDGKPIRYLVPERVRSYIEERGLYRATVNAS